MNAAIIAAALSKGGPAAFSKQFFEVASVAPNTPSYTFSGVGIGAAAPSRQLVLAFGASLSASDLIAAVTISIGGSPVTLDWAGQGVKQSAGSTRQLGMLFANIPTGTTADITVDTTTANTISRVKIGGWILRNSALTAPAARSGAAPVSNSSTAGPLSAGAVTVPAGGFLLGAAYQTDNNAINGTQTSGTLDEDWDGLLSGSTTRMAFYSSAVAGSQNLTVMNAGAVATNMRAASLAVGP